MLLMILLIVLIIGLAIALIVGIKPKQNKNEGHLPYDSDINYEAKRKNMMETYLTSYGFEVKEKQRIDGYHPRVR